MQNTYTYCNGVKHNRDCQHIRWFLIGGLDHAEPKRTPAYVRTIAAACGSKGTSGVHPRVSSVDVNLAAGMYDAAVCCWDIAHSGHFFSNNSCPSFLCDQP